ncbi:hypothetical protein BDD12DRAFT_828969 [Trichophaea hybrida]|nr:hypothetical protein BDD12DRAFT_828969 [Trichophaea hybrida]
MSGVIIVNIVKVLHEFFTICSIQGGRTRTRCQGLENKEHKPPAFIFPSNTVEKYSRLVLSHYHQADSPEEQDINKIFSSWG